MKRQYHKVVKVSWDSLWHVYFRHPDGSESYVRVTEARALKIAEELVYD